MLRNLPVFLLIFMFCATANGQFNSYQKYNYKWETDFPKTQPIDPQFQHESIVILSEEHSFAVSGTKSRFMKIYVETKQHIAYVKSDDIVAGSHFELPYSFDPTLDRSDVPRNNTDTIQRPKLYDVKVLFFAARIKKGNGSVVDAVLKDKVILDDRSYQLKAHRTFHHYFSSRGSRLENNNSYTYIFQILNLEAGDELEIHYKYEIPYEQNWYLFNSKRVFFQGKYPKQDYSFTFHFKKRVGTTFLYNNGAKPVEQMLEKEKVAFIFKERNLAGGIDETNSRPHLELPFFVYNLNPLDARFFFKSSFRLESAPLPFWIYLLKLREEYSEFVQMRADPIVKDKQWRKVQTFIVGNTAHISKDNVFSKLNTLHNTIVDDFEYQKGGEYFARGKDKYERLGDQTEAKTLSEISRFKLYVKIFNHLNIPYNTVYFMDKRVAEMGLTYISPVIDNEYAFAVPILDRQFYVYPKQNRCGYYGDELPFYWENSKALYIEFHNLWAEKIADLNFITTHASNSKDNIRVCNIKTSVNLNQLDLACEAKVSLSGQFSTMTRNVYAFNYMDSTLNPLYGRKINYAFEPEDDELLKPNSKSAVYPFKTNFRMSYSSSDLMVQNNLEYQISLNGWFPHVVENDLDEEHRDLRYYPDFQSQDLIKYFFVFSDSVKLLNKAELDIDISNSFGAYTITADQLNPTTIMIASEFRVTSDYVDANNIGDVAAINKAIGKLNEGVLVVQKDSEAIR